MSLSFVPTLAARDEIDGPVSAKIIQIIDGDTLLVAATPWPQQTMEVHVRIRGIDAPEIHSKCTEIRRAGLKARDALQQMISGVSIIQLRGIAGDKYFGRILADVTFANGGNPAQDLLSEGLVRAYDGGRKPQVFCAEE
ncbi:endonuclease YncB(thermonuclease family) [Rhizobium sp. BK196]|uniref:thermonuclease family protein n=1 Tax=Rhizobium sp. BK196 TaxID=2587073 RepID=UPI0018339CE1|nr:thermonuclease family protein [Rhizobium sp. BK196]MBB3313840.1 endonuclease YncB(thermonuclease family) [Rhizobium sp. BK196]